MLDWGWETLFTLFRFATDEESQLEYLLDSLDDDGDIKSCVEKRLETLKDRKTVEILRNVPRVSVPDDYTCPVCWDKSSGHLGLRCGHVVCEPCITRIMRAPSDRHKCPMCRHGVIG